MKVVKWILIGLVVLVVAVGATFYAILRSLNTDELRGFIEAQAEQATGRKLRLKGPIDLSVSLTPAIVLKDVSFDNADWGSRPELLDVGQVEAQVALMPLLQGRYVIQRVVIENADILLETDKKGEGNWALSTGGAKGGAAGAGSAGGSTASGTPVVPEVGSVEIRDSRLVYRDGATGESLLLNLDSLEVKPDGDQLKVSAEGSYQEAPFELSGRLGGLPILMKGGDLPVQLSGKIAGAEVSADGRITDLKGAATPDIKVQLQAESLDQFDKLAGSSLPPLGPLAFSGRIGLDAGLITVDGMALSLGGSDLAGTLTASLKGARPAVLADLTGAKLDLSDFAKAGAGEKAVSTAPVDQAEQKAADQQAKEARQTETAGGQPYVIPDTPLPLAALKLADAQVKLKLGQLIVDPELTLGDVELALRLENGKLDISKLRAKAFEGQLDGTLSLDAGKSPAPLATKVDVKGLSVGELLKTYAGSQDLETSLDVALDLKGRGDSPRAIASSLNGSSEIVGGEGVINNRILAIVATGLDQILGPLFGGEKETKLNCLVSRFRFENGLAVSQAQLLDSSTFSLAGAGTVNLKNENLDLKFDTRTREAALVSLAIPFVVRGTLADPKPAPDALGAAMKASEFVGGGSNPLAALGEMVSGQGGQAGGGTAAPAATENSCVTALEQTADVPASKTPIGSVKESLDKVLKGDDAQKALDSAKDTLGKGDVKKGLDDVKKGLEGLFKN
ncbi:hypothetical protein SAMN06265365_103277 [Tistlia consotensis]|uniref:AsmA domain-containing protein n=1 Tax=Tistlia consotensis USBA 355 TaxID=560819 RepID=A0A1Y6C344_9PROT|nr:AsmA family protein [Tistlia consotensis]SMF43161.1 hypothetical protein SAMN05428998_11539 [Tistlia consotensis USBA 355]SNR42308.1 hypothetical protein SAMN06265365_103277 [Tistlia consotensis]